MLYTIGHSTHPAQKFIALLKRHGVVTLADIRSVPMSRFNPQFRQKDLKKALEAAGLRYVYGGGALGGQPRLPYAERRALPEFRQALEALKEQAAREVTAIMCAEKEPLNCHRTLLVARALAEENFPVAHIMASGDLRVHAEIEKDMLEKFGRQGRGLFDSASPLEEAYARRSAAGAYQRK